MPKVSKFTSTQEHQSALGNSLLFPNGKNSHTQTKTHQSLSTAIIKLLPKFHSLLISQKVNIKTVVELPLSSKQPLTPRIVHARRGQRQQLETALPGWASKSHLRTLDKSKITANTSKNSSLCFYINPDQLQPSQGLGEIAKIC